MSALVVLFCGTLVLYPMVYLVILSVNTGDPLTFPPETYGTEHYEDLFDSWKVIANTAFVACIATVMAIVIGFLAAWTLTRTNLPGVVWLERLMQLPYYMTPLVGALAWSILAAPNTGFLNQLWHAAGGGGDLFNAYSPWGIAWVMALFEGTVAFVMISAAMKSMDPALEESARVLGAGKWRVMLTVTLPLVMPGVAGAAVFVFAEMLGSFAAAFVLGIPARFVVITTAIWQAVTMYPADYGRAAALGIALFAVMFLTLEPVPGHHQARQFRDDHRQGVPSAPHGDGTDGLGSVRAVPVLCLRRGGLAARRAAADLVRAVRHRDPVRRRSSRWPITRRRSASPRSASRLTNSLILGVCVATVGVAIMAVLVWIIYRSRAPGHIAIEYLVMFPQAVPRLVFGLALMMAWLIIPIPIYGTLWLMALAYFTVLMPLGVRTLAGVVLQIDKSLEECARVCGASWFYQMRTVTLPLLRPGIIAAWLLVFIASVRELGVSIFLVGSNAKVIAPSIIDAWLSSSSTLSAALALIQSAAVFIALFVMLQAARRYSGELP